MALGRRQGATDLLGILRTWLCPAAPGTPKCTLKGVPCTASLAFPAASVTEQV